MHSKGAIRLEFMNAKDLLLKVLLVYNLRNWMLDSEYPSFLFAPELNYMFL